MKKISFYRGFTHFYRLKTVRVVDWVAAKVEVRLVCCFNPNADKCDAQGAVDDVIC